MTQRQTSRRARDAIARIQHRDLYEITLVEITRSGDEERFLECRTVKYRAKLRVSSFDVARARNVSKPYGGIVYGTY